MKLKLISGGLVGFALVVLLISSITSPVAGYYDPILEELTFTAETFESSEGFDYAISSNGLEMAPEAFTTIYTSPVIEAPISFNVVIPQWIAHLPEGSSLDVQIRTKTRMGEWSVWRHAHTHGDWTLEEEELEIGELITVPLEDGRHTHMQYTISMSRYNSLTTPVVEEFTLIFIDSTGGPSIDEMIAQQAEIDAQKEGRVADDSYPRPTIISRDVWCISDNCNYIEEHRYSPATHMVVHHTVSSNEPTDWAAIVRAIWSFHTHSRGWGDIGYNYLVDQNGIIYEGHYSDDYVNLDVEGAHSGDANLGSMGVALIGTFTESTHAIPGITPPSVMVNSLVDLLSWKADQRDINVYDATNTLPEIGWGLPHLMGHRNVFGSTECPGDQAHNLIPYLVEEVAANIGITNEYTVVDERSSQVTHSFNWAQGPNECGNNIHSYYTWSTTDPNASTHWAKWQLDIPAQGYYDIQVRVPYCLTGRAETSGASYEITHDHGTSQVVIDQNREVGNWISLGTFLLSPEGPNRINLTDLTTTDSGLGIWVDDLRWKAAPPSITAVSPSSDYWLNTQDVTFEWSNTTSQTTTLQISNTPTFSETIVSQAWATDTISYTHSFTEDIDSLYWQVSTRIVGSNDLLSTDVISFGIDTAVPTSTVTSFFNFAPDMYRLTWEGIDELSGIQGYDVAYRPLNTENWTSWLTGTQQTAVTFIAPNNEQNYEFRIQAIDNAGNRQPEPLDFPNTEQAIALPHAIMIPIIRN